MATSEITTRDCELQGKAKLVGCRLQSADLALFCCSEGNRRSFGDLAGLDRPQGLPPVRVDSGKGRLAFSNPQPTAFPSHAINVSITLPLCLLHPIHATACRKHMCLLAASPRTAQDQQTCLDPPQGLCFCNTLPTLDSSCKASRYAKAPLLCCGCPQGTCLASLIMSSVCRMMGQWSSGWMGRAAAVATCQIGVMGRTVGQRVCI